MVSLGVLLLVAAGCAEPVEVGASDIGWAEADASSALADAAAPVDADGLPLPDAESPPDSGTERPDAARWSSDAASNPDAASVPVDDGTPIRVACTSNFGGALTKAHGRLDGYLVSIVEPGHGGCNDDSDHVHLQLKVDGAVYDVAVNVASSTTTAPDVSFAERDEALADGAWAEGWHPSDALDYVQLGLHSGDFVSMSKSALVQKITEALAGANHVSIFATGYGGAGVHLVHRNGGGRDGAVVLRPLSGSPHYLMFHFADQTF